MKPVKARQSPPSRPAGPSAPAGLIVTPAGSATVVSRSVDSARPSGLNRRGLRNVHAHRQPEELLALLTIRRDRDRRRERQLASNPSAAPVRHWRCASIRSRSRSGRDPRRSRRRSRTAAAPCNRVGNVRKGLRLSPLPTTPDNLILILKTGSIGGTSRDSVRNGYWPPACGVDVDKCLREICPYAELGRDAAWWHHVVQRKVARTVADGFHVDFTDLRFMRTARLNSRPSLSQVPASSSLSAHFFAVALGLPTSPGGGVTIMSLVVPTGRSSYGESAFGIVGSTSVLNAKLVTIS